MQYSNFVRTFNANSGAKELMEDMSCTIPGIDKVYRLGGGNPAIIPEVREIFRAELAKIAADPDRFDNMASIYSEPLGDTRFREALADMLREEYGWPLTAGNISLAPGSQLCFYYLFNLFGGVGPGGKRRRIIISLCPEYIGYKGLLSDDADVASRRSIIRKLPNRQFKYGLRMEGLDEVADVGGSGGARPNKATGNVIRQSELARLDEVAREREVPLIVDNAYGFPFPGMIYVNERPEWNDNTILTMSLSKIGLPALRTGIVVANEEVTEIMGRINALTQLAVGAAGAALVAPLLENRELLRISRELIMPFYQRKTLDAVGFCHETLTNCDYYIHKPEGSMFLWLWFPGLNDNQALYRRLKTRGVMILSGHEFFPGLQRPWTHERECIRVNVCGDADSVFEGLRIIGEEASRLQAKAA
ncbi:MAG: aminotransferase class I/II-fold pyridoxal phosphate-dependent enzyme [Gammaproteobacteria bacterium]|nr:aminotransferase class I/II-fold pyridoxal phosphate-dependent enzyme [Gammaproteobacteria bacterium]